MSLFEVLGMISLGWVILCVIGPLIGFVVMLFLGNHNSNQSPSQSDTSDGTMENSGGNTHD